MKNLARHLSRQIDFALIVFCVSLILISCSKEEKTDKYIAKVNDAVLTEDDLRLALSENEYKSKYRSEYIHNWIEQEILFQEAVKKGIVDGKEYKSLMERSRKQLAASMFINKVLEENKIEPSEQDIQKFFDDSKDDFKLIDDAFRVNIIQFNNFDKAVQFRNTLIESDWGKALNAFRNDQSIISSDAARFFYRYQIQPMTLLRIIGNLQVNEVSIVLETEPMKFTIVQLLDKYGKDVMPSFEIVKDEARARYLMLKQKDLIREYIDKLIADHNLEIKRYSE